MEFSGRLIVVNRDKDLPQKPDVTPRIQKKNLLTF